MERDPNVFPAPAGMNRVSESSPHPAACVPRASGDEPHTSLPLSFCPNISGADAKNWHVFRQFISIGGFWYKNFDFTSSAARSTASSAIMGSVPPHARFVPSNRPGVILGTESILRWRTTIAGFHPPLQLRFVRTHYEAERAIRGYGVEGGQFGFGRTMTANRPGQRSGTCRQSG